MDILEYLESIREEWNYLNEAGINTEHLRLEILDQDKFLKRNNVQEVSNPVFFVRENTPTPDGLLSNEIFGITTESRSFTYAYIDLHGLFIDPSCYKVWCRLDSNIKACVHSTDTFIISEDGELVKAPNGKSGVKFLKDNFDKLKIRGESRKRDINVEYLMKNKDRMFISKYFVVPPSYRDVNSGANVGVGEINRIYSQLLVSTKSLTETKEYGLMTASIEGRIQELILCLYDLIIGNNNSMINEKITGLAKKEGLIHRAGLSKTPDYAARLVLSAPELKVHTPQDLMVNVFRSALPLAAALTNFKPYIIFNVRRFFENNLSASSTITIMDNGVKKEMTPKDPLTVFSDERIEQEIEKFVYSYNDRIRPITFPLNEVEGKEATLKFKGRKNTTEEARKNPESIYVRPMTWLDVFYIAAVEATKDKCILITRFPMDSFFNQFPTEIVVSSTIKTEPMMVGDVYYPYYPYIREELIGSHTGNYFYDTLQISNVHLGSIGGDYDGDMMSSKGSYFVETNEELRNYLHSKAFFIDLAGSNVRKSSNESVQAIYNLTKGAPGTIFSDPVF